jgi:hypothetical protein
MRFVWATILDPFRTFRYGIGLQILFKSLSNPRCRTTMPPIPRRAFFRGRPAVSPFVLRKTSRG